MRQASPAPTERSDTSIARQGYDHRRRISQGLKDRRITRIASRTLPPKSIGHSDLFMMIRRSHSLPLRSRLCWYQIGLSDLTQQNSNLEILSPLVSQLRWLSVAPTERPDTSIARQGYDHARQLFQGLKDRRNDRAASPTAPPSSIGLSDLHICALYHIALRYASDYAGIVMLFQSLRDRRILSQMSSFTQFNPNLI